MSEIGINMINRFLPLSKKDLTNYNSFYFINVTSNNICNFKNLLNFKLLDYRIKNLSLITNLFLDQNIYFNNNSAYFLNCKKFNNQLKNYYYLPSSNFYENNETFINTEGVFKKTNKLIFNKKKNNWQIIRKFFNFVSTNTFFFNNRNNNFIFLNLKKLKNFKNYINFNYQATKTLTTFSSDLLIKNESFLLINNDRFKNKLKKVYFTKMKYWLDDFFSGGRDEFSHKSSIVSNSSKILYLKSTNFF